MSARVVVTGMGAVTGLGMGVPVLEKGVFHGQSAVAPLDFAPGIHGAAAREVAWTAEGRGRSFVRKAVAEAVAQAGLSAPIPRLAVFLGTAHGNLDLWLHDRARGAELWSLGEDIWGGLAETWEASLVTTACTASAMAMGQALDTLRAHAADVAIVVGVEVLTPFLVSGFGSLRSLATGNCRPFDQERDGLVLGEGAGALVLETRERALDRGAPPLAELAGFGTAADATTFTAPDPAGGGAARALALALEDARLDGPPDSVNAHGTGTRLNDRMECIALRRVFGESCGWMAITATKPVTGHMCGAAGAVEAIVSILSLTRGEVPPILGFTRPDRDFAEFDFVRGTGRKARQRSVVSLNSAFGGTNTAMVFRAVA